MGLEKRKHGNGKRVNVFDVPKKVSSYV